MLPHYFFNFAKKLILITLIVIFSVRIATAQYGPLYWDLRNYDSIPAYRKAMHAFDARDYERSFKVLDSVADVLSRRGAMSFYHTVQNEKGAMLYISSRYNESVKVFSQNVEFMRLRGDTLNHEHAIALRFLAYLHRIGYKCGLSDDLQLLEREFNILTMMNDRSPIYADCLSDLGMRYLSRNMKRKALDVLMSSRELAKQHNEMNSLLITDHTIVNNLGDDQPTLSLRVFESMYHTTPCRVFRDSMSMTVLAYSIATRLSATGNHDKALYYYDKADTFNRLTGYLQHSLISGIPLSRSVCYARKGDYAAFRESAKEALTKYMANPAVTGYSLSELYITLTSGWINFSADSAMIFALKADEHATNYDEKLELAYLKGRIMLAKSDTLKAIDFFTKATELTDNSDVKITTSPTLLEVYKGLVELNDGDAAYRAYCTYDTLAVRMVNKITDREELLRLSAGYYSVASAMLNKTPSVLTNTLIFAVASKAKAFALAGAVAMNTYGVKAATNDSIWQIRVQLEEEITRLENENIEELYTTGVFSDSAMAFGFRESLIRLLALNLKILNDTCTVYIPVNDIKLGEIQAMLDNNRMIIDIFRTGTRIIVTGISNNSFKTFTIEDVDAFDCELDEYRKRLKTGKNHNEQSEKLGKMLLKPLADMLETSGSIIFIPDSKLQQVPLDLLANPQNGRLLLETHSVTYHYSISLWRKNKATRGGTGSMLAIAPVYSGSEYLPGSAKEVSSISRLFKSAGIQSTALIGEKATKQNIKSRLPDARILHIAAHTRDAREHDRLMGVRLNNRSEYLYTGEFEQISKNLMLVVLSGCNTATGQIHEGEGALALTRGLIIGGVPNIVATLWRINDQTTGSLIDDFYANLLKGNDYAESLRLARLKSYKTGQLPLYWAGFVLIGK